MCILFLHPQIIERNIFQIATRQYTIHNINRPLGPCCASKTLLLLTKHSLSRFPPGFTLSNVLPVHALALAT